tara:strand:+ start:4914 stop:5549 length:636 start_codon:yes stop_codon:yes gene_type:complete
MKFITALLQGLVLTIIVVTMIVMYASNNKPTPPLFSVSDNFEASKNAFPRILNNNFPSKVNQIYTLESPMKGLDEVLRWGASKSLGLFTTNFNDYYKLYDQAARAFTDVGWSQVREQLVSSGLFEAVVQKKLVSTAIIRRPPVLIRQGVLNGRWTWQTQFEMMVNYESASENLMVTYVVTLRIVRVPVVVGVNNSGLAIDSLVAEKAGGTL